MSMEAVPKLKMDRGHRRPSLDMFTEGLQREELKTLAGDWHASTFNYSTPLAPVPTRPISTALAAA